MQVYNGLDQYRNDGLSSQLNGGLSTISTIQPYGLDYCQTIQPSQQHYHYHNSCLCGCRSQPHDSEIVVELVGKEIKLDYGPRLRLLIADPIKGHDLRYALAKLQEALLASVS
jgi:hypothetical protein